MSRPTRFSVAQEPFEGLEPRTRRWLDYEQTLNDRLNNDAVYPPIDRRSNTVRRDLYPDQRANWNQTVVWIPDRLARRYGPVDAVLRDALGIRAPIGRVPLLLHPQAPVAHTRLAQTYGNRPVAGLSATATSSYRSVLVWRGNGTGTPAILKLSMGAVVAGSRRVLRERQIARAVVISLLFDAIPDRDRTRLGLDWFPEPAGAAETVSRHGWLARQLPRLLTQRGTSRLLPVFSLISRRGRRPPILLELIARSRRRPERWIVDTLLKPYVDALAYLIFAQGLQYEGHTQNVLFEIDRHDQLTGRIVLRDFSDTSVNIAFRVATGQPLPWFAARHRPAPMPFSLSRTMPRTITAMSAGRESAAATTRSSRMGSITACGPSTRRSRVS